MSDYKHCHLKRQINGTFSHLRSGISEFLYVCGRGVVYLWSEASGRIPCRRDGHLGQGLGTSNNAPQ